jgi:MarR family transcriptional regulator, organic hydroperoxide resistance regulator
MQLRRSLSLISKIEKAAHSYIKAELNSHGVKGLVLSHGEILATLYFSKRPLTMKEISEQIRKTQPTVTVLIDKLIELDYVKKAKSPTDARISYITLTEQGEKFKKVFLTISENMNKKMHHGLSANDIDCLEKTLTKVLSNFSH